VVCGSSERRRLGLRGDAPITASLGAREDAPTTTVYRCRGCRLVYCDPIPSGDTVEDVYGGVEDYFTIPIDEARLEYYRSVGRTLLDVRGGRAGRLLDVGCGRGEFVHAAGQVGWEAHGIDPDAPFVEYARARFGLETVTAAEIDASGFPPGSFDAITLNGVLEHIPEPVPALEHAARLLAPDGVLFFEVPNGDVVRFAAADLVLRALRSPFTSHLSPFRPPYHLYEFSPASARRLVESAGLTLFDLRFHPGTNRFPRLGSARARLLRFAYGALVGVENATGRTYNLHAYARRHI
jgi:2-polyprenyl-3-methyl-5-hydroxy-6-metoxy-1,4-benzoquinol methylase